MDRREFLKTFRNAALIAPIAPKLIAEASENLATDSGMRTFSVSVDAPIDVEEIISKELSDAMKAFYLEIDMKSRDWMFDNA